MAVVYKATNILNGYAYIGVTKKFSQRLREHKSRHTKNTVYFHNAIKKCGWMNFKWEILHESLDYEFLKSAIEPKCIVEHNTFWENGKGYNLTKVVMVVAV